MTPGILRAGATDGQGYNPQQRTLCNAAVKTLVLSTQLNITDVKTLFPAFIAFVCATFVQSSANLFLLFPSTFLLHNIDL
jgi:hypothetical protein